MNFAEFLSDDQEINYTHYISYNPQKEKFYLHNHKDLYEILIFIKGNSEFRVEGSIYKINPYDILITHETEMHIVYHNTPFAPYERAVFHVKKNFFYENHCEEFLELFTNRPLGINNVISAKCTNERKIKEIVKDTDNYINDNDTMCYSVVKSKLLELLYNIRRSSNRNSIDLTINNDRIKDIILYINNNIRSDLSLDIIASKFFVSKYHLCHIFKEHSGITINKYINQKRILLVKELVMSGWSLKDASLKAGFNNYSNFYKVYMKEMGMPPKKDLKQ